MSPPNSNPPAPNYNKNFGRLVTDRYDFESHIDGSDFRHDAKQIDLEPNINIINPITNQTTSLKTVFEAVENISNIISNPIVLPATNNRLGIITLSGDIEGSLSATDIKVSGLRGKPISNTAPNTNDVLTWDGNNWIPSPTQNLFFASGDLQGTSQSQQVVKITGYQNILPVMVGTINFSSLAGKILITQDDISGSNGFDINIVAQKSLTGKGGNVKIIGGKSANSYNEGGVTLGLGENNLQQNMLQVLKVQGTNNRVLSLLNPNNLTSSEMPSNSGDMVIYIKDAAVEPSSNPVGGAILYSIGGKLNVRYQNGSSFEIGEIPNPSVWGDQDQQVRTYRFKIESFNTFQSIWDYNVDINTTVKFDMIIIGKQKDGGNESYQANISATYTSDLNGIVQEVGNQTIYDKKVTNIAQNWGNPEIKQNPNDQKNIIFQTGYSHDPYSIYWLCIIQAIIISV